MVTADVAVDVGHHSCDDVHQRRYKHDHNASGGRRYGPEERLEDRIRYVFDSIIIQPIIILERAITLLPLTHVLLNCIIIMSALVQPFLRSSLWYPARTRSFITCRGRAERRSKRTYQRYIIRIDRAVHID